MNSSIAIPEDLSVRTERLYELVRLAKSRSSLVKELENTRREGYGRGEIYDNLLDEFGVFDDKIQALKAQLTRAEIKQARSLTNAFV